MTLPRAVLGENAPGPLVAGGVVAFTVPQGTVTVRMRARRALSWSRQQVKRDGCHVEVQLLANPPNGFDKALAFSRLSVLLGPRGMDKQHWLCGVSRRLGQTEPW